MAQMAVRGSPSPMSAQGQDVRREQMAFKRCIAILPPGFVHNLTPTSYARIVEAMGVRSGDRGLELGCGVGFGAVALVSGGCNYVYGIDVNEQAIEAAGGALGSFLTGRNATVEVVVGNILNQSDCNFDVAMCIVGASHPTRHALELFRTSTVMRSLALLLPSTGFRIKEETLGFHTIIVSVALSVSGERRRVAVVRK